MHTRFAFCVLSAAATVGSPLLCAQVPVPAPGRQPAAMAEAMPATATTLPAGTINLDMEGVDAAEAFAVLARQSGIAISARDPQVWLGADPVFIKVTGGYFWPTFVELCRQARLSFNPDSGENRAGAIRLVSEERGLRLSRLRAVESQGLLLIPRSAQRNAAISFDRPDSASSGLSIQMLVLPDPRLGVSQIGGATVLEAVDENGLSLAPARNGRAPAYGSGYNAASMTQSVTLGLAYPAGTGQKIARVKGYLRLTAATQAETVEIESPLTAKPLTKQLADCQITIEPLKELPADATGPGKDGARYQLKIIVTNRVSADARPGVRSRVNRDLLPLVQNISITDAQGRRLSSGGAGGVSQHDNVTELDSRFYADAATQTGTPVKLSWRVPVASRSMAVPFELLDLPIP